VFEGNRVGVVVPAYREERGIAEVITTMPSWVDHVIVVDDCSPDATSARVREVADDRVLLVRHERNQGVGGAILTGHRHALELGCDLIAVMAGDGQMDPAELPRLLQPLVDGGAGFAKANRFFSVTSMSGMPRLRVFGNVVLTILNKAASGYWHLVDPQNGYTAMTAESLRKVPLDRVARRYEFQNDMLIWLAINEVPAVDVPVPARYRDEVSGIRYSRVIPRMLWLFFRGFWRRMWLRYVLWSFHPVALLVFAGIPLLVFGLAVGAFAVVQSLGTASATAGTVLLAVTPALTGIYMLIQAMILDVEASPRPR
jgi:glycosyltransferase involved in cell wall biosynthesis